MYGTGEVVFAWSIKISALLYMAANLLGRAYICEHTENASTVGYSGWSSVLVLWECMQSGIYV